MEVVYVSEDIMVTRTNYDHFCVRTKLYQYWNPAADAGWMYVDGVQKLELTSCCTGTWSMDTLAPGLTCIPTGQIFPPVIKVAWC